MILRSTSIGILIIALVFMLKSCTDQSAISTPDSETTSESDGPVVNGSSTEDATDLPKAALEFTLGETGKKAVNPMNYGFNTAALYFHYSDEPSGEKLIKGLEPNVLRFPGGTTANFYHFDGPGYGHEAKDAQAVAGSNAYQNAVNSAKKDKEDCAAAGRTNNYAVDFAQLAKDCGASVLLVTNHLNSTMDENLRMVKYFKDSGVKIAGIELGNEYYLNAYKDEFPDADTYVKAIKPLAVKLKTLYPEIPLAVVAASITEMKDLGLNRSAKLSAWNDRLAGEDFYDAYIVHLYAKDKACDEKAGILPRFDCYVKSNNSYIQETIPDGISAYKKTFGNRPMWITEWNVREVFEGLGNTMLQALYYADFSLMISDQNDVSRATYHNLLTSGTGFNIIGKEKGSSGFTENAAYFAADLIKEIFTDNVFPVSLSSKSHVPEELTVKVFTRAKTTYLYVVNRGKSKVELGFLLNATGASMKIQTLYASNLSDSASSIKTEERNLEDLSNVAIDGYAISLITVSAQ